MSVCIMRESLEEPGSSGSGLMITPERMVSALCVRECMCEGRAFTFASMMSYKRHRAWPKKLGLGLGPKKLGLGLGPKKLGQGLGLKKLGLGPKKLGLGLGPKYTLFSLGKNIFINFVTNSKYYYFSR